MRSPTLLSGLLAAITTTITGTASAQSLAEVLVYNACPCSVDLFACRDQGHGTYQIPNNRDEECNELVSGGATSAYVLASANCTLYAAAGCAVGDGDEQVTIAGANDGTATYACSDVPFGTALSALCVRL